MRGRATQSGHLLARKGEVRRLQQSLRPASATPSSATTAGARKTLFHDFRGLAERVKVDFAESLLWV